MTKRIFRAVCISAVTVLCASIILIMGVLYGYFNDVRKNQIKAELSLAKNAVETEGVSYLENLKNIYLKCSLHNLRDTQQLSFLLYLSFGSKCHLLSKDFHKQG